jgi:prepilin-type N-terminal cleavage/methylation domain-containing protein
MTRLVRGTGRDDGLTLVELLITMVIMGVVGIIVTSAMVNQNKLFRSTEDQSAGLQDVRVASERLGRDIRDARAVLCNPAGTPAALAAADPTCRSHLQVWIDYNSDYKQQAAETVTWQLRLRVAGCTGSCFYDLVRSVGSATAIVEAHTIINILAFTYDVAPGATQPAPGASHAARVDTEMTYDARKASGDGTGQRTVLFSARLRNVS